MSSGYLSRERIQLDLRNLDIPEIIQFGRYNYRAAHKGLNVHSHPRCLEICFLAKGKQLYRVNRQDYLLTANDIFVTFPGEAHSTGQAPEEKGMLYWIQVKLPEKPSEKFFNCAASDGWNLVQALLAMPHRHFPGEPGFKTILDEALLACHGEEAPLRRLTLQNKILEFLLGVIASSRKLPRHSVSPLLSELLRYIEKNTDKPVSLKELANRIHLSLPRFKARFKNEVGIPPADYILRCKIKAAQNLLTTPSLFVTGIAFDLGFSSSQYFATVFKRYTGKTPQEWRKEAMS